MSPNSNNFYIVLSINKEGIPLKDRYHWRIYEEYSILNYHIIGGPYYSKDGLFRPEIEKLHIKYNKYQDIIAIEIGELPDKKVEKLDKYLFTELILENDNCMTFLMKIIRNFFSINNNFEDNVFMLADKNKIGKNEQFINVYDKKFNLIKTIIKENTKTI